MDEKIPLESVIVKQIIEALKDIGYPFVHKIHGNAYQAAGLPDIIVIDKNGRFVGLECKRPRVGRLTALQAATLNKISASGGYAAVVTSVSEAMDAMRASEAGKKCEIIRKEGQCW